VLLDKHEPARGATSPSFGCCSRIEDAGVIDGLDAIADAGVTTLSLAPGNASSSPVEHGVSCARM
jgi:hypothetical protein